ncbi:MAG: LysR family transcriptional regulator [Oceanospirillaceae bacterium]|nr:LysR family transcriptional regulator [Oceanospirillaceae bacterium]
MHIDFVTLQLFATVAEQGNMAKAAETRNIVPSAVSKRISDLEHALRVPLLHRKSRGVELTAAGEVAYKYARNILRLVERFEGEMSEFSEGDKGRVRIAACPSSITQFLPQNLAGYIDANPLVKVDLVEEVTDVILRMVRDGLADIGVTSGLVEAAELEVTPYRQDRLAVLAPLSHPIAVFDSVSFEETLRYRQVGLQQGSSIQRLLVRKAEELGRSINFSVSVMGFDGVRKMVEAGLGITILPKGSIEANVDPERFKIINLKDEWASRTLELVVREQKSLPLVARHLLEHLAQAEEKHG